MPADGRSAQNCDGDAATANGAHLCDAACETPLRRDHAVPYTSIAPSAMYLPEVSISKVNSM